MTERRDQIMKQSLVPILGPATMIIDWWFSVKLLICTEWDAYFGLSESHPFSTVRNLKMWYEIRRPWCMILDGMCPESAPKVILLL